MMLRRSFLKSALPVSLMPQLREAPRIKITNIRIVNLKSVRETGKMEAAWKRHDQVAGDYIAAARPQRR